MKAKKMEKNLECPFGIPEDQCCQSPTCKTFVTRMNTQKTANEQTLHEGR